MKRLLSLALVLVLVLAAAPAAAVKLTGSITPADDGTGAGYACLVKDVPMDAQNGPDVIVKGTLTLPNRTNYWVQVGLVPEDVYNDFQAHLISSMWGEGVYATTELDGTGDFLVAAEDYPLQTGTPARYSDTNQISFKLTLKPKLRRTGGWATLKVNGRKTNLGSDQLRYGWPEAGSSRSEKYLVARLVVQVKSDTPSGTTDFTAVARQLKDAVRITKVLTRDANVNNCSTFGRGEVVNVLTKYRIVSIRERSLTYEVRGDVKLFGGAQDIRQTQQTGKYGVSRSFMVPWDADPGKYKIRVRLQLVRHLIDRYSNEPYEEILYREEVYQKITVVE